MALLLLAVSVHHFTDVSWWWFVIGFLLPDISMFGYLFGNKIGAYIYNVGHSLIASLVVAGVGYFNENMILLTIGVIWIAHIGFDRALGYGLKEAAGFHHTHLGKIGKAKKST